MAHNVSPVFYIFKSDTAHISPAEMLSSDSVYLVHLERRLMRSLFPVRTFNTVHQLSVCLNKCAEMPDVDKRFSGILNARAALEHRHRAHE